MLLQRMLKLLAPSASFAVWCPFLQPLADAMQELQARLLGLVTGVKVVPSSFRHQPHV